MDPKAARMKFFENRGYLKSCMTLATLYLGKYGTLVYQGIPRPCRIPSINSGTVFGP